VSTVPHAALRGMVGAMAMTGVRLFAVEVGLIDEDPPRRLVRRRARGLLAMIPRRHRRGAIELSHWAFGATFGAGFGLLPERLHRRRWAGPAYGLLVYLGFDLAVAPLLGVRTRGWPGSAGRVVFVADHLLYGLVLSELHERPRE
jgi:hypothetical protein